MFALLVSVALGVLFAVFATQNTGPVSLNLGGHHIANIPLYLAVLVPLLIGLLMALFFHLIKDLSQSLTINEQKDQIKNLKKEVAEITKEAHKFQLESSKLKEKNGDAGDGDSI
jgi:uncharacterized integral membrane protein